MAASIVTLAEITFETVRDILKLDAGDPGRNFVAANALSLAEAQFNPGAWFRAVYRDETPLGFVMLLDPALSGARSRGPLRPGDVFLWRLMIDHRSQRSGLGRQTLDRVRTHVSSLPHAARWVTSAIAEPGGPEGLYLRYGFQPTGQRRGDGSEVELAMPVTRAKAG